MYDSLLWSPSLIAYVGNGQQCSCWSGFGGGGQGKMGRDVYLLYIPVFTTVLYYFIGCPYWKVPNNPWRSGCMSPSSPLFILPEWSMAISTWLVSGFFSGYWDKCFVLSYYRFHWAPILHLDMQVPNEPWSSECIAISYSPFPFLSLQATILKQFVFF